MKRKKGVTRQLIESLAQGESDLHALAGKQGMSLIDLARWIERPRHAELLRLLENLQNRRMSLLLAAARADAAESLRNMAIADAPRETARKACVDLLKLQRERDPVSATSDGSGDNDLSHDPYASINRVIADIASEEFSDSDQDSNRAARSAHTASTATQGETTHGEAIQESGDQRSDVPEGRADAHDDPREPHDAYHPQGAT